jgi:hypothetical protein
MGHMPPMARTVLTLFKTRPEEKIPREEGVFGIAAQVVLKSGYGSAGVFTIEEDGVLRIAQPGMAKNPVAQSAPPIPIIANHYFTFFDLETIVIVDELKPAEKSRIVMEG